MAIERVEPQRLIPISADWILKRIQEAKSVRLNNAQINGDIDLSELDQLSTYQLVHSLIKITSSEFKGKVKLCNGIFKENAQFEGVTFIQDARFDGTTFCQNAHFNEATFIKDARFIEATFGEDAYFEETTFNRDAYFYQATFGGEANFSGAKFRSDARFLGARFEKMTFGGFVTGFEGANFDGATFGGNTWFSDVKFKGDALFAGARFRGNTWFDRATFRGYTYFGGAISNGEILTFKNAKFALPSNQEDAFRRAKNVLEKNGDREEAGYHFYKEMEGKRKQKVWYIRYPEWFFIQFIFGYGVHPFRLMACWLGFVGLFTIVYLHWSGIDSVASQLKGNATLADYVWFSIATAVTPGYAGYKPTSDFKWVAGFEAIFGTFMWAAFIATFSRKYMR